METSVDITVRHNGYEFRVEHEIGDTMTFGGGLLRMWKQLLWRQLKEQSIN